MAQFSSTFSVAGVNTANSAIINLKTPTTKGARVTEVALFISAAPTNAVDLVLTRMNAVGTGTITQSVGNADDQGTSTVNVETAWATTRPTMLTTYLRRMLLGTQIGNGIIWSLPRGIYVPANAGLVLGNVSATGATLGQYSGYITWDE